MRRTLMWIGFPAALMMALALTDGGDAQAPPKKGKKKGDAIPRAITADEIVDRILSFDKDKIGKITADDLPERMQHLVALGDVNKDGALDKDEARKLAVTLEALTGFFGGPGPGGPPPFGPKKDGGGKGGGPKGGGPKGFGPKGGGPKGIEVQQTIDELNLTGKTRDKAQMVANAHLDKVRGFQQLARFEVILQMQDVLNEDDYRIFKSALDRPSGPPGFGAAKQPDFNRRIDQLQKELTELRPKIAK